MTARLGFWLALVAAGLGAGLWFMWGQVTDARARAVAAEQRADDLSGRLAGFAKALDELQARQLETDQTLAARGEQDAKLQAQLYTLRADLKEVMQNDAKAKEWGAVPVPDAIAGRLWGPSGRPGATANHTGAATGESNPRPP